MMLKQRIPFKWLFYGISGFFLLLAIAGGFGWNLVRNNVVAGLADWRAQEKQAGRDWTCPDETVSGFPFRIEIRCNAPTVNITSKSGQTFIRLEGLTIVSQIYNSEHIIAEAAGPMNARFGDGSVLDFNWQSLSTSASKRGDLPERLSLMVQSPAFRLTNPGQEPATLRGEKIELHIRPNPQRYNIEGAVDLALTAPGLSSQLIDTAIGGREALDVNLEAVLTRAYVFAGRSGADALETWRLLGGSIALSPVRMTKGPRRLMARGDITIDDGRRLSGRIDMAAAGIDDIYARVAGDNPRIGALISSGISALAARQSVQTPDGLKPMLPLRFEKGRFAFGPFVLGPLPPLY
jgi:hypothetical protein